MPWLVMKLVFSQVANAPMPFFARPVARQLCHRVIRSFLQPRIDANLAYIDEWLRDRPWFVADRLTVVDIQMSYVLEGSLTAKNREHYPAAAAWLDRVRERPAYQSAINKGGHPVPS